jgi:hypothetical protein
MTSPLANIKETFHSIFWKAGKLTLQTSSSPTHQFLDAEAIHTTTPLPITLQYNQPQAIVEIYKMTEVHVDLIGPWTIP